MCQQESFKAIKHFNNTKESMHAIRFNLSGSALSVAEFGRLWHLPLALYDIETRSRSFNNVCVHACMYNIV